MQNCIILEHCCTSLCIYFSRVWILKNKKKNKKKFRDEWTPEALKILHASNFLTPNYNSKKLS